MIPYTISYLLPSSTYTESENISVSYLVGENRNEIIQNVIKDVVEYMYEFCSKEYGYGLDVASYYDFCEKWWKEQECKMENFYIFEVHYFDNDDNCWNKLEIKDYEDEIYDAYIKKYGISVQITPFHIFNAKNV